MQRLLLSSCRYAAILVAVLLLFGGCDLFGGDDTDTFAFEPTTGVIVANSGNFGDQNGFLTVYDPIAARADHLPDLGAFVQSLVLRDGRAYVVVNTFTTGRIDVIDLETGQRTGQVQGLPAPRYLAFAADGKAYASNFVFGGEGTLSVINTATNTVVGAPVEVGGSPEGIVVTAGKAFVADYGNLGDGTTLAVIDAGTDRVASSVALGCDGPKDLLLDADGQVVVICQGKTVFNDDFTEVLEQSNGQVLFVDPATDAVVGRILFEHQLGSDNFTQAAYVAPEVQELYVLSGSAGRVYRIDTEANAVEAEIAVPESAGLTGLTAVAYNAGAQRLYVGRFAQGAGGGPDVAAAGGVVILGREGRLVNRFTAGPSPAHIDLLTD